MPGLRLDNPELKGAFHDRAMETNRFNPDKRVGVNEPRTRALEETRPYNPDNRVTPNGEIKSPVTIENALSNYLDDITSHSEAPQSLSDVRIDPDKLREVPPEENAQMRNEFRNKKAELISNWEQRNNMAWPRYEQDVKNEHGEIVRCKGSLYDAHHIHPLSLGGPNTAENLTPLHVDAHRDLHRKNGPCSYLQESAKGDWT